VIKKDAVCNSKVEKKCMNNTKGVVSYSLHVGSLTVHWRAHLTFDNHEWFGLRKLMKKGLLLFSFSSTKQSYGINLMDGNYELCVG